MKRADCPAFNITCLGCGIKGHYQRVCRKRPPQEDSATRSLDDETLESAYVHDQQQNTSDVSSLSYIFMICTNNTSAESSTSQAIPHMEWNGERFVQQAPRKPPRLTITVEVLTDRSIIPAELPFSPKFRPKRTSTTTLADSGAQTCSGDTHLLAELGCTTDDLLPTSHGIRGVTNTKLHLLGVLPVRITTEGRHTNQIMYFAHNTRGCLLSEKALRDLHILPDSFPSACQLVASSTTPPSRVSAPKAICGCLKRLSPPPMPSQIPFTPHPKNINDLEMYIRAFFAASAFNTCKHQPLPYMTGDLMTVTLRENAVPHAIHTPLPVPLYWEEAVIKELANDVSLDIIERVASTIPTIWCAKMVVVAKKDGSPRRTVDFQKLNAATIRHTHHTPSPFQQVIKIPRNMFKSVLDAWNGYHSILLDETARNYFTFLCSQGRFRYKRCPQGYHGSGDIYTHHFDDITRGFSDKVRQIDDSCLWKPSIAEMFWHTMAYIHHCTLNGVIFNPKKFVFCKKEVEFAGFLVTNDGIKPSPRIMDAIRKFPTPKSLTDVRSWFGLVNQVSFAFAQTELMLPFRELLKHNQKFYWDQSLESLFQSTKLKIIAQIEEGIKSFDCKKATCLSTDWCKNGVGFFLFQQSCACPPMEGPHCGGDHWKVVFAGSRFTTDAESRYHRSHRGGGTSCSVWPRKQQTICNWLPTPNCICGSQTTLETAQRRSATGSDQKSSSSATERKGHEVSVPDKAYPRQGKRMCRRSFKVPS